MSNYTDCIVSFDGSADMRKYMPMFASRIMARGSGMRFGIEDHASKRVAVTWLLRKNY
jgi:hypothetical protein